MSWKLVGFESLFHLNQGLYVHNITFNDPLSKQRWILSFPYIILKVFDWSTLVINKQQHIFYYLIGSNTGGFQVFFQLNQGISDCNITIIDPLSETRLVLCFPYIILDGLFRNSLLINDQRQIFYYIMTQGGSSGSLVQHPSYFLLVAGYNMSHICISARTSWYWAHSHGLWKPSFSSMY